MPTKKLPKSKSKSPLQYITNVAKMGKPLKLKKASNRDILAMASLRLSCETGKPESVTDLKYAKELIKRYPITEDEVMILLRRLFYNSKREPEIRISASRDPEPLQGETPDPSKTAEADAAERKALADALRRQEARQSVKDDIRRSVSKRFNPIIEWSEKVLADSGQGRQAFYMEGVKAGLIVGKSLATQELLDRLDDKSSTITLKVGDTIRSYFHKTFNH
jgi:hypothetical protein